MDDEELAIIDRRELVCTLEVPRQWEVDDSGLDAGILILRDPEPSDLGFHVTLVLTQATLEDHPSDPATLLRVQEAAEELLAEQLTDYRPLHLALEELGEPAQPAVFRVASYTTEDGVPVAMHQWAARAHGVELSLTLTSPMVDFVEVSEAAWALAGLVTWKGEG